MEKSFKVIVFLDCKADNLFKFSKEIMSNLLDIYDFGTDFDFTIDTNGVISDVILIKMKESMISLRVDDTIYELNFVSKDLRQLVDRLCVHGLLNGWYTIDVSNYNDPKIIGTLINDTFDLKFKKRINKPKLFISCPMNDCNSKKEVMERLQALRRIAVYAFQKDFEFINTWIDEEPSSDVKHQRVWYAGKSLELLSEANYYLGIEMLPHNFYGCHIENYTAENLNIKTSYIAYDIFKLFNTTEINTMLDVNPHFIDPFLKVTNNGKDSNE